MAQGFNFCRLLVIAYIIGVMPELIAQEVMSPDKGRHQEITIRIYNYAEAPRQTGTRAKMEIAKILNLAGVMTRWIDCPVSSTAIEDHAACQERMLPSELAMSHKTHYERAPLWDLRWCH